MSTLLSTMNSSTQDWAPVQVRCSTKSTTSTVKRPTYSSQAMHLRKVEESDGPVQTKTLSHESRQELMKARTAKGFSQVELTLKCGFPANSVRDIESGRSIPSGAQLSLLNRHLCTKLSLR